MSGKHSKLLFLFFFVTLSVESLILSKGDRGRAGSNEGYVEGAGSVVEDNRNGDSERQLSHGHHSQINRASDPELKKTVNMIVGFMIFIFVGAIIVMIVLYIRHRKQSSEKVVEPIARRRLRKQSGYTQRKQLYKKFNRQLVSKRLHSIADHAQSPFLKSIRTVKDLDRPDVNNRMYHAVNGVFRKLTGKKINAKYFQREFGNLKHFALRRFVEANKQRRLGLGTIVSVVSDYLSKKNHAGPAVNKMTIMLEAARVIQNLPLGLKLLNNG